MCHSADGETESQKGGRLIQGHPTWNQTQEMCSSPKAVEASRPLGPTSTRSVGFRNSQLHEYKVARIQPTVWFHDLFHSHPIVCQREGWGWLVARSLGCPVTGWACLIASQSGLPELALERPWPHLAGTLYLCPGAQKRLCLAPAVLIPHAPDCPSPSALRKAHFVKSKD